MKTTVDIPEAALNELMAHTKANTKREAIIAAVDAYNQKQRVAAAIQLRGSFKEIMTPDELSQLRDADLNDSRFD
ncbi:MAG: type II toxin-antitoxin system VapB family antitoxin [Opitutales bacterium]